MVPHLNDGTPYTVPVAVTFGVLLNRYIAEEMPSRKSATLRLILPCGPTRIGELAVEGPPAVTLPLG